MFLRPSAGVVVMLSLGVSVVTEGSGSHLSSPAGSSVVPGLLVASSESCAPLGFSAGAAGDSGCSPGPCSPTAGAAPSPASLASWEGDEGVLIGDCGVVLTGTTSTSTVPPLTSISSLSGFVSAVVIEGAVVEVDSDVAVDPSEADDAAVALEEVNDGVVVDLVVFVVVAVGFEIVVEVLVVITVVVVEDWVVLVVVVFGSVVVDLTSIFEVVVIVVEVVVVEVVVVVVEVVVVVMVTAVGVMLVVVVVACVVLVSFFAGATPPILKPASEPSG